MPGLAALREARSGAHAPVPAAAAAATNAPEPSEGAALHVLTVAAKDSRAGTMPGLAALQEACVGAHAPVPAAATAVTATVPVPLEGAALHMLTTAAAKDSGAGPMPGLAALQEVGGRAHAPVLPAATTTTAAAATAPETSEGGPAILYPSLVDALLAAAEGTPAGPLPGVAALRQAGHPAPPPAPAPGPLSPSPASLVRQSPPPPVLP
eukprot:EG_transcript_30287